ncbi:putative uncharacterized protein ASB16-AS1 [Apodemus sylvaticus]|uniref:putative uncharacterized protein ASB16-AS1 n=1 Tax=Apodemus sylvaticus TaxID=10129 RepID=UPI00224205EA|nr:putative uncharacterized protein ASB16-AS1 [Apodemus sylvaticus]
MVVPAVPWEAGAAGWATRYAKLGCCPGATPAGESTQPSSPDLRSSETKRQSRKLTLDLQPVVRRGRSAPSLGTWSTRVRPQSRGESGLASVSRTADSQERAGAWQVPGSTAGRAAAVHRSCSLSPPPARAPGAARASLAPAVRAARSRAERGGAGPRPGPGFPRTRPRGERPRAPPRAAGRPGERLVPGPPPTRLDGARPHHPATPS